MDNASNVTHQSVRQRWDAFRVANPNVRIRNAAAELGVSEAELVAVSDGVTRLVANWGTLIRKLESLGEVMALTRNDFCVHEKTGVYRNVKLIPDHQMGQVADEQIDLRIFFRHWKHGFAVETPLDEGGVRRSLQFFDASGTAVHKIFLRRQSDLAAYRRLVEKYQSDVDGFDVEPRESQKAPHVNPDVNADAFIDEWSALNDTHDFFPLIRKHDVGRRQAVELAEGTYSERIEMGSARSVLQRAAEAGTPIMVFVGNHGCLQIHTGPVKNLKETPPWYNVLDPGFQLHLNEEGLDAAWVVRKPTSDGDVTSVELFDRAGELVVQFFGKRKPPEPELESWRELVGSLPRV